jgi:methionyl-tRNA formyltransferase
MTIATPAQSKSIRAVVFCDVSFTAAHHIKCWTDAGHKVAACIISSKSVKSQWRQDKWRQWFAPEWSLKSVLNRQQIPLIRAPGDLRAAEFETLTRDLQGDVLISVAFPHRIPSSLTALFRSGGVNSHPALLPHYRGPHPTEKMALDGAWDECAGITLHRIADGFDEGDIIAQLPFPPEDIAKPEWHSIAFARRGAELLVAALPAFVEGKTQCVPQPAGTFRYARFGPNELVLTKEMSVEDISLRACVLGRRGRLSIELDGHNYRIGGFASAQQSCGKVQVSYFTVAFGARNGTVKLYRENRLFRRYREWMLLRELLHNCSIGKNGDSV